MKSKFVVKVLFLLTAVALSPVLRTTEIRAQNSPASKENHSTATQKQSTKVDVTTDPSPAQKGSNTIRVKLTDLTGNPITGAQVTVTFSMAAMPAMGMAAMKTVVNATDKGDGIYEGKGDLGSSGNWQVRVTAHKDGQTIATKRLTVHVTGGM